MQCIMVIHTLSTFLAVVLEFPPQLGRYAVFFVIRRSNPLRLLALVCIAYVGGVEDRLDGI